MRVKTMVTVTRGDKSLGINNPQIPSVACQLPPEIFPEANILPETSPGFIDSKEETY